MNAPTPLRMTAAEFLAWSEQRPHKPRFELIEGEITEMAPERVRHTATKGQVFLALHRAVAAAGLPCVVLPDGPAVVASERSVFEPDAVVLPGPIVAPDAITVEPLIVVEVLSPSTARRDLGPKLAGYTGLSGVAHYLIVDPQNRVVVWHARGDDGAFAARVLAEGALRLDPPGLTLAVADLFPAG